MVAVNHSRKRELIKIKLSEILKKSSGNPKFEGVTIIDVKLSPDSSSAVIFFSVFLSKFSIEEITKALNKSHGFFQVNLANTLKSRNTPKLNFVFDKGFDHALKIDNILGKLS